MIQNTKVLFAVFLTAGTLLGGASAYVGMNYGEVSPTEAGETVATTLEDQTGAEYEVINVEEENGLYTVRVSAEDQQLETYHVTKDGQMLSAQMTSLQDLRESISLQNNVQQCLEDQDTVLYGNLSEQTTQVQIQALGGAQKVANYYKDVNNEQNLQEATDRGIETVPTLWVDGQVLEDVNNLEQISEFADC